MSSVHLVYDDQTTEIFIPKTTQILSTSLKVGKVYKILLDEKVYVCEVLATNAELVKLNGVAESDQMSQLFGWYDCNSLQVLEKDL